MQSGAVPTEGRVFHTLDALRGIAALGVVVFHMSLAFAPLAAPAGYLAVDLFFMMSGAVLSHAYEPRFRAGMGVADFMRARLIRLYPLYLAGILCGFAVTLASLLGRNTQHWDAASIAQATALSLLFLPSFGQQPVDQLFPLNIPCWSLFLELVVNLLFVAAWRALTSRVLSIVCALTGAAIVLAVASFGHADLGSTSSTLVIGLARTLFGFAVGVLIARHVRHDRRHVGNAAVLLIVAVVGVAIAGRPEQIPRRAWDLSCVLFVFPLIVAISTRVDPGAVLGRAATFLGVTSYAVYVLHSPLASVVNSARRIFDRAGVLANPPLLGVAVLVVLLVGCWLIDRYYDVPVRRMLGRLVPRTAAPRARR